jgi:hypothetical protein
MYRTISIEAINDFITNAGVPAPEDADKARELCAKLSGYRSQGEFAAHMINLSNGTILPADLTDALACAFPAAKIGTRHGPHYLCLARTGKLAGTTIVPAKATRVAGAAKAKRAELEATIARLTAALEAQGVDTETGEVTE